MAWMSVLYRTYENNQHLAGKTVNGAKPLAPVSHSVENTHLAVYLSANGEFVDAIAEDMKIIIPVTEASSSRTSGIAAHCLCDNLAYLAGDFGDYAATAKEVTKAREKFKTYIEQLSTWVNSPYAHPVAEAVYAYLCKKELIADLVGKGLITLQNDKFDNGKLNKMAYEKVMVRFCVNTPNGLVKCWEDESLIDAFIRFYAETRNTQRNICFLTGESAIISENHPKNIVAASYGAKLVCANDNVYRGRFVHSQEALTIGYDATQKAHAALSWLVSNQGVNVGTKDSRTYVCWNPNGKRVPVILGPKSVYSLVSAEEDDRPNTQTAFQDKLRRTLQGFAGQLDETDDIVLMSLEAATTGRLSITYYNSLQGSDFLARVERWGNSCNWHYFRGYNQIETPTFESIVKCAFGTERGNFIDVDDKILREHTQRLVHAMLTGGTVPCDIVRAMVERASNPLAYNDRNYKNLLSTVCAVISQRFYQETDEDKEKEVKFDMSQAQYENDRSFLYGRLLAIFDKIERDTYDKGEARETNAHRLQAMYVKYPHRTRRNIEEKLIPYFEKLINFYAQNKKMNATAYYKKLIGEISVKLIELDRQDINKKLDETYLLGYYLQRQEFYKTKEETEETLDNKND